MGDIIFNPAGFVDGLRYMGLGLLGTFVVIGIIVGIIGMIGCGINYPIYKRILEKGKKKYAYEIVELAREISEGE